MFTFVVERPKSRCFVPERARRRLGKELTDSLSESFLESLSLREEASIYASTTFCKSPKAASNFQFVVILRYWRPGASISMEVLMKEYISSNINLLRECGTQNSHIEA